MPKDFWGNEFKTPTKEDVLKEKVRRVFRRQYSSFLQAFNVVKEGQEVYCYAFEINLDKKNIVFEVESHTEENGYEKFPELLTIGFSMSGEEGKEVISLSGEPHFLSGKTAANYAYEFVGNVGGGKVMSLNTKDPNLKV